MKDWEKLVKAEVVMKTLFEDNSRPNLRWLREQTKGGYIPCYHLGRMVRYRLSEVMECMDHNRGYKPNKHKKPSAT